MDPSPAVRDVLEGCPLIGNVLALFSVELYRIVFFIEQFCNGRIAERFPVHYFTPSTPIGVDVNKDFSLLLLRAFYGLLKSHPLYLFVVLCPNLNNTSTGHNQPGKELYHQFLPHNLNSLSKLTKNEAVSSRHPPKWPLSASDRGIDGTVWRISVQKRTTFGIENR